MSQLSGIVITGSGSAVPAACLDNAALSQIVETSDEWIADRTGIHQRHLATPEETLCSLAAQAARHALEMAGLAAADLDLIILATSTADDLFGSASKIQAEIGAVKAVAFDLTAACSGFVFGLVTAASVHPHRHLPKRAADWRRYPLALDRLERPPHLRFVWRRSRGNCHAGCRARPTRSASGL